MTNEGGNMEELNEDEMAHLNGLLNKLPEANVKSPDYTAGYMVGYRVGLQNAFMVAALHNDGEAVQLLRDEYEGRIGLLHVVLVLDGQDSEEDRALVRKYAAEVGVLTGQAMWELDIVKGAYPQVQSAVIEGHEESGDPMDEWDPLEGEEVRHE